jgi:hypothetical protein
MLFMTFPPVPQWGAAYNFAGGYANELPRLARAGFSGPGLWIRNGPRLVCAVIVRHHLPNQIALNPEAIHKNMSCNDLQDRLKKR